MDQLVPLKAAKEHLPKDIINILELLGKADNILFNQLYNLAEDSASFKADGDLWGPGRAPPMPDVPSSSHDEGKASKRPASQGEAQENEPPGQRESPQDQPPS